MAELAMLVLMSLVTAMMLGLIEVPEGPSAEQSRKGYPKADRARHQSKKMKAESQEIAKLRNRFRSRLN